MKVEIRRLTVPLKAAFTSSRGSLRERELLLLSLEDGEGRVGWGEAAPLPSYDGVTADDVADALGDCVGALEAAPGPEREELLAECRRLAVLPQALAAVDLALWDLTGRREGQPVWQLLGAQAAPPVEVNYTISAGDRAGAADAAASARRAGFGCLKAKVAIGDDAGRLAAIRATAGPEVAIRIDANGAWSLEEAELALSALAPVGIELCEEPVRGLDAMARLSGLTGVPLALDETASAPGALEHRVCAAVCLKIARCGGISGLVESAAQARAAGYEVYLASTLDGPLGIAAALHAAAVVVPDRPSGLATLSLFEDRPDPFQVAGGRIAMPEGPGLGVSAETWYACL